GQRPARLIAPGLLAIELARLAGPRVGHDRSTALERPAIGDLTADERRVVEMAAAGRRTGWAGKPLAGQDAACATLRLRAARGRFASGSAACLAPTTRRSRAVA